MENSQASTAEQPSLPPGNSAVEIAARKGFGPLSALSGRVWHGDGRPCPSCGQLVRRESTLCDTCDENLTAEMASRMRAFSGPWYVLDHVRPFPGVTYERFLRQIRRGVLTETTVVRGPSTHHQWRFAGETPGLCKYLGVCWKCHGRVIPQETICSSCGVELGELSDGMVNGQADSSIEPELPEPAALKELRSVVESIPRYTETIESLPTGRGSFAGWIVSALLVLVVAALLYVVRARDEQTHAPSTPAPSAITAAG